MNKASPQARTVINSVRRAVYIFQESDQTRQEYVNDQKMTKCR
jgi:hypothetical protein